MPSRKVPHQPLNCPDLREVVIHVSEIFANHGTGHSKFHPVSGPDTHDFDVFTPCWVCGLLVLLVDQPFGLKHEQLQTAQRCIANSNRCIIRNINAVAGPAGKESLEIVGAGSYDLLKLYMPL